MKPISFGQDYGKLWRIQFRQTAKTCGLCHPIRLSKPLHGDKSIGKITPRGTSMFHIILTLALIGGTPAKAQEAQAAKPKKNSTDIYEKEEDKADTKSFTAKVRIVRDISDDIEVFFEGNKATGAYSLSRNSANFAAMLKALEASKEPKGAAVTVTADSDKNIKTVEINKSSSNPGGWSIPDDPNKKWDFGKVRD